MMLYTYLISIGENESNINEIYRNLKNRNLPKIIAVAMTFQKERIYV